MSSNGEPVEGSTAGPAAISRQPGTFIGTLHQSITAGPFIVGQWTMHPAHAPSDGKEHSHATGHLIFVAAGQYVCDLSDRGSPTLVFSPPGTVHSDHLLNGVGCFLSVEFRRGIEAGTLGVRTPAKATVVTSEAAHALCRRINALLAGRATEAVLDIESICLQLFDELTEVKCRTAPPQSWLRTARDRLRGPFDPDLTITTLARELGVHPVHLNRTFKANFGCTPAAFARAARLKVAADLICRGSSSLCDIALECGFSDQSHLANLLRNLYGFSPGRLRRLTGVAVPDVRSLQKNDGDDRESFRTGRGKSSRRISYDDRRPHSCRYPAGTGD